MIDKIGDIIYKTGVGIGIVLFAIAAIKYVSRPIPKQEPITVTLKTYGENEIQVEPFMDSVSKLSHDEQLIILRELAQGHARKYGLDTTRR